MSELIYKSAPRNCRVHFLATASISALVGFGFVGPVYAGADTANSPTVWIELGGQLDHLGTQAQPFSPSFTGHAIEAGLISPLAFQKPSNYAFGEEGGISIQPEGSKWSFSADIKYGRSNTKKYRHQQQAVAPVYWSLYPGHPFVPYGPGKRPIARTADYTVQSRETHTTVDFRSGRDVGLGLLSREGASHVEFGVRFAQFTSKAHLKLSADPDPNVKTTYSPQFHVSGPFNKYYQFYKTSASISRSFNGLGPSLAWSGTVPIFNAAEGDSKLALDFGANLSVLFGRQKVRIQHQAVVEDHEIAFLQYLHETFTDYSVTNRSRSVVVPNVGGMAGISLNLPNAKISVGYRADFFFGAMDGGIDTHKSYDRNFYGPFATISIGLP